MAQWDAVSLAQTSRRRQPWWRLAVASIAVVASVAALVIVVTRSTRPADEHRRTAVDGPRLPAIAEYGVPPRAASVASPVDVPPVRRPAPRRTDRTTAIDAGYVLVPDAAVAPSQLMVMRLRMPRTAFARLGVPIADPDAEGLVDVEVLVGEDGVARSIRRAAAVGWSGDVK
jgi:hypothetical protein